MNRKSMRKIKLLLSVKRSYLA